MADLTEPNLNIEPTNTLEAEISENNTPESGQTEHAQKTSLETIVEAVLGSATVANKSAEVASASTEMLLDAVGDLTTVAKGAKSANIALLSACGLLLIASAGALFTVSIQLNNRLNQANTLLARLANKSTELTANLETLQRFDGLLENVEGEKSSDKVEKMGLKIDAILGEIKKPPVAAPLPIEKSQKPLEISNQAVTSQMRALESKIQSQTLHITTLNTTIQSMRGDLAKLPVIEKAVSSMTSKLVEISASTKKPATASTLEQDRLRSDRMADYIKYRASDSDKNKETN